MILQQIMIMKFFLTIRKQNIKTFSSLRFISNTIWFYFQRESYFSCLETGHCVSMCTKGISWRSEDVSVMWFTGVFFSARIPFLFFFNVLANSSLFHNSKKFWSSYHEGLNGPNSFTWSGRVRVNPHLTFSKANSSRVLGGCCSLGFWGCMQLWQVSTVTYTGAQNRWSVTGGGD